MSPIVNTSFTMNSDFSRCCPRTINISCYCFKAESDQDDIVQELNTIEQINAALAAHESKRTRKCTIL